MWKVSEFHLHSEFYTLELLVLKTNFLNQLITEFLHCWCTSADCNEENPPSTCNTSTITEFHITMQVGLSPPHWKINGMLTKAKIIFVKKKIIKIK